MYVAWVIEAPLTKAPLDTSIVCHWLAVEGLQPTIPDNAPVEVIAATLDNKKPEQKDDGLSVDIKLPVKHVLSRELQLYFDKITELAVSRSDSVLYKETVVSLATDSGLHPLVPYFTYFIADEIPCLKSHEDKQKAVEHLEQQPPPKKVATDGPINIPAKNSLWSAALGNSDAGASPFSRRMSGEGILGSRSQVGRVDNNQALNTSAVLNQAWKDDLDLGRRLVSLFELFGESIFNFIPTPEMSSFL
ncbi:hypothetical protein Vadar_030239 [Vaccinium darrowii]|uniref:Uncharacterized protein n=1 Tax=Vaccinium darrowii TaxID=229202 RepID=A0ACB7XU72_9ERIC|nr:hypothetical protein Vadar_030239 [Vaccinium darrowii]